MSTPLLVSSRDAPSWPVACLPLLPMLAGSMANLVLPALGAGLACPFASPQWVLGVTCLGSPVWTGGGGAGSGIVWGGVACCSGGPGSLRWLPAVPLAPSIGWVIAACTPQGPVRLHAGCLPGHGSGAGASPPGSMGLGTPVGLRHGARPPPCGLLIGGFGLAGPFLPLLPGRAAALGCLAGSGPGMRRALPRRPPAHQSVAAGDGAALLRAGTDPGQPTPGSGRDRAPVAMVLFAHADSRPSPLLPPGAVGASRRRGGSRQRAGGQRLMVATMLIGPFYLHGAFAPTWGRWG